MRNEEVMKIVGKRQIYEKNVRFCVFCCEFGKVKD